MRRVRENDEHDVRIRVRISMLHEQVKKVCWREVCFGWLLLNTKDHKQGGVVLR